MLDIFYGWGKSFSQEKRFRNKSFLKKPLVALSLLIIVIMCLSIAEAAPRRLEHKMRHHKRHLDMDHKNTKDNHQVDPSLPINPHLGLYKNATIKITKRLKNTNRFFKEGLRELNESRKRVNGNPAWLPKMNFVNIQHKSEEFKSLKRRFTFLMPKLYKHLTEYRVIFERLKNVVIVYQDDMYHNIKRRKKFLTSTISRLDAFITEVTDAMDSVHMPTPKFDHSKMNLSTLHTRVDGTQCSVQDHIAYRGYENLLKNWDLAFKCTKKRKGKKLEQLCRSYVDRDLSKNKSVTGRVNTLRRSLFRSENLV